MALLQISEPNQTPNPHTRRIGIGIDLGTTNSLVAATRSGAVQCLPDHDGAVMLPSVVRYLDAQQRQIGQAALHAQLSDPANTITSVKRLMGRGFADIAQAQALPYRLTNQSGMVGIETAAGVKSPVEVSAEILALLRQRAEDSFDAEIDGAVITVPAYFDDAQRQATKDAARLAGLQVLRLINEPTAAAIAYGLDNPHQGDDIETTRTFAVYDLGGGTFDVSILRLCRGVFEVVATGGDSALGGDDFDQALVRYVLQAVGLDSAVLRDTDKVALQRAARTAKEALTSEPAVNFCAQVGGTPLSMNLTRAQFVACTESLTQRTLEALKQVMRDAKLKVQEVDGTVLVGGATRMPQIQAAVAQFFGKPPLTNLNPDEVVALGAAIQANQLLGNRTGTEADDLLLLDVIPLSLGIETMGGLVERIVPRNQTIPTAMAQDFTTYQDGQTAIALHVVQGERDLVADCRSLARFELRGIPPMVAGAARVRVTFTVDADGLLGVSAQELTSGVHAQINVKPSYGLSDEQIAAMLRESARTASEDMAARALAQARLEVDRMVLATRSALEMDRQLLSAQESAAIEALMAACLATKNLESPQAIEAATKQLAQATESFAAARMNAGIAQALSGKNINHV